MILIEQNNAKATKEYLKVLFGRASVSFNEIYNILGVEKKTGTDYRYGQWAHFHAYLKQNSVYPQRYPAVFDNYWRNLQEIYRQGDYFHMFGMGEEGANERMIINLKTQEAALILVSYLLKDSSAFMKELKFFGKETSQGNYFKYDKLIIYYRREDRERIFDAITRSSVGGTLFLRDLSGFYDIYGQDENNYIVGIGKEIPGTSFTTESAFKVTRALTGREDIKQRPDAEFKILDEVLRRYNTPEKLADFLFTKGR